MKQTTKKKMTKQLHLRARMAAVAAGICGYCKSSTGEEYRYNVTLPQSVCDIGCDHGKLAVWLAENTEIKTIVAADKNHMPLQKAATLAQKRSADIITKISDGLSNINPNEAQLVTISGMSGITMVEILDSCDWLLNTTSRLVLLPACKDTAIEAWLTTNNIEYEKHQISQGKKSYSLLLGTITND